jgi:hypothetical protein
VRVGKRLDNGDGLADQGRLARTAALLRGTPRLAPRGVYRFSSFEEAEAWMNRAMAETARPQDALDRAFLEGVLREREESE